MLGTSPMLEKIMSNPMTFFFGCVMFVPVAIWTVMMLHWMIAGDIDVIPGVLGIGFGGFLLVTAINPPVAWLSPVIFGGLFLLAIMLPIIRRSMNERELRLFEIEQFEKHLSSVIEVPNRYLSRMEVARELVRIGLVGHAVGLTQDVKNMPIRQMEQEKREVRNWESSLTPQNSRPIRCLKCGAFPELTDLVCPRCKAPFLALYLRGNVILPDLARKLIFGWIFGVAMLLAIPTLSVTLPPQVSLVLVPFMLFLGAYAVYRAFFKKPMDAA